METNKFKEIKQKRRIEKRTKKRNVLAEEVIFIFEKVLEGWQTNKIYNVLIQTNPQSNVNKKKVEQIATGNCKVFENELNKDRYQYYIQLREQVYNKVNTK